MISLLCMNIDNQILDFKSFPITRYQGSKRKILPWIHDVIKELKFHTALDACGGSGSVSYLLKKMGKSVTYNDKLHFNYLIGKAIIENSEERLLLEDIANLQKTNINLRYDKFIQNTFKDVYYLPHENEWLDKVVGNIVNMNHYKPNILEYKKALSFYAVFQASLIKRPFNLFHRKNLNIRTADVKRNFGNKVSWETPFNDYLFKFATEANNLVFDSGNKCEAKNSSILDLDPYGYDLVYIDPPYIRKNGSNESSNYFNCYHFLEGLSKYKDWDYLIDYNSSNLKLKNGREQDDFSKEKIHETLEKILYIFRKNTIVLSYKKGGIPSIEFIKKEMQKMGKKVYTRSIHYQYALNHQNGDVKNNREVLIIGI